MRTKALTMLPLAMLMSATLLADTTAAAETGALLPDKSSQDLLMAVSNGGNGLVSPASLFAAIGMSRAGLPEGGRLEHDLGWTADPDFQAVMQVQPSIEGGGKPPLTVTNAVWTLEDLLIGDAARERLRSDWGAMLGKVYAGEDPARRINEWVSSATGGEIEELVTGPLDGFDLAIVNTVSFENAWVQPFDEGKTEDKPFLLGSGEEATVPFLIGDARHPCWKVTGGIVTKLAFAEAGRYLLLHMPDGDSADAEPAGLPPATWLDPHNAELMQVEMPELDLSAQRDMRPVLDEMGLTEAVAFGLGTLALPAPQLGPVAQAVKFRADARGASASAATAMVGVRSLAPPAQVLRFNRPFSFFLMDPSIPIPLVAGHVADPR